MRAADDFAVIRARLMELEQQRRRARREQANEDEELDRMDLRAIQRMREGLKTARNRLG